VDRWEEARMKRRSRSGFRVVSNGCECELVVMPERKDLGLYNVIVIGGEECGEHHHLR
jgi:hypothetical protein